MTADNVAVDISHSARLARIGVRAFTVPAPPPSAYHEAVRPHRQERPIHGWLVGVSDGRYWGWWGPVAEAQALAAPGLFDAAFPRLPAQVEAAGFARQLRRATRHAHTGLLALTVGALELALWDLLGKRAGLPVWALLAPQAVRDTVPAYATTFGVDAAPARVATVMEAVALNYPVQKWRPQILQDSLIGVTTDFVSRIGPGRLAVDFFGTWRAEKVRAACDRVSGGLAWVEEPYSPEEVHTAEAGEFGVPHAAGEHCYSAADALHLQAGHVDIWQPDAVFCGGLMTLRNLVRAAARAGARCAPHGGGLLPALHLAAIGEPIDLIELHLLLEPRRCAHLAEPPMTDSGQGAAIPIPRAPGWCGDLRQDFGND